MIIRISEDKPHTAKFVAFQAHDAPVVAMAVDASGGLLATASADRRVLVWDTDGGFCTHAFKGHTGVVSCVQFHPDIHQLLVRLEYERFLFSNTGYLIIS